MTDKRRVEFLRENAVKALISMNRDPFSYKTVEMFVPFQFPDKSRGGNFKTITLLYRVEFVKYRAQKAVDLDTVVYADTAVAVDIHAQKIFRTLFLELNIPKSQPFFFEKGVTTSATFSQTPKNTPSNFHIYLRIIFISLHNLKERSPALQVKYSILSKKLQVLFYNKLCFLCVLSPSPSPKNAVNSYIEENFTPRMSHTTRPRPSPGSVNAAQAMLNGRQICPIRLNGTPE